MTQPLLKPVSTMPASGDDRAKMGGPMTALATGDLRWLVIPLSVVLCTLQAVATILASNLADTFLTSTLIPIMGFVLLFAIVLIFNPALRLAAALLGKWARPLNRAELICLFTAMLVTSGISTFGLTEYLVPLLAAPNDHEPGWNTQVRAWDEGLVPNLNPKLYIQDEEAIKLFRDGVTLSNAHGEHLTWQRNARTWSAKFDYCRQVFKAIPWMIWIVPLAYWMVFIFACYALFYCLTFIVISYWADREKLIFPLARLYEAILPEPGGRRYQIPPMLRDPGFWVGFSLSFLVLSWNALFDNVYGLFRSMGLSAISLGAHADVVRSSFTGTIFQGLITNNDSTLMFLIVFAAIGIAFLLPLEVSFSVWFYYVMGRCLMLVLIWTGHAASVTEYPANFLWETNPVTALGGGGVYAFSAICLFRCIRDYARLAAGKSWGRRLVIGLPVVGLVGCVAVVVCWLQWNHMPVGWAIFFVICFGLLTIGLMRMAAESGMYWFQTDTGFFHLYRVLGLGNFLAPLLAATILPLYAVLFMDMKTFLALNLPNAVQMQRNSRVHRWKFHLNLALCIALTVAASLFTAIFLAHLRGGVVMNNWFYNSSARLILDTSQRILTTPPTFNLGYTFCYVAGALWVGLSIYLRTTFFWFPHPIGFIMLIDPLMAQLWFSFFLGWICKWLTVHYGGKALYDRVRGFFIGLIAGELVAVLFWTSVALWLGTKVSMRKIGGQDL